MVQIAGIDVGVRNLAITVAEIDVHDGAAWAHGSTIHHVENIDLLENNGLEVGNSNAVSLDRMYAMCTAALWNSASISLGAIVLELWSLYKRARRRSATSYAPRRRAPDAKWLVELQRVRPLRPLITSQTEASMNV